MAAYLFLGMLLAGPPLLGLAVSFSRSPRFTVPLLASGVAIFELSWLLWESITPQPPCRSDCWDSNFVSDFVAVITTIWWIFAAIVGYLATLLGEAWRTQYDASSTGTRAES